MLNLHYLARRVRHIGVTVEQLRYKVYLNPLSKPLRSWFYCALSLQYLWNQKDPAQAGWSPFGNYYEFGVGGGGTMLAYIKALKAFCKHNRLDLSKFHIIGFDSFEGLPAKETQADDHPHWRAGSFAHEISEIREKIRKAAIDPSWNTIHLVKGWFKETLTPTLRNELKQWPPAIITVDVDYYSSAKIVLEWLRPILKSGALFYFDDIWVFHGNPFYGELRAINEFNQSEEGQLVPYPAFPVGFQGQAYMYWTKDFKQQEMVGRA